MKYTAPPPVVDDGRPYNPITNEVVDAPKHLRVQKGSFQKEADQANRIDRDVDPITLEKYHAPVQAQGVPPPHASALEGVFATFQRIDAQSVKCPKCAQPIYVDGNLAYKGPYIEKKAIYNTVKGHAKCFMHPQGTNMDPTKHKPEFVRYTCCLATIQSGGCQLRP